ncbi:class B sortase [Paucilactobacillus hokkaidonensis]|nr:class B sortase [Paucilactobacillus hokkaidonensis]
MDKRKKSTRSKIINILLLLVVLVGIYFVGNHFYQHYKVEQEVQATKTLTTKTVKKMPTEGNISINWKKLHKVNPRIKAWVYVPGTKINYAILQSKDNKFYLHHDEHNKSSISGQIFMDYRNHANFSSKNTFIYGHNMYDKTRFSDLSKYFSSSFLNAHKHVYIYTPTKKFVGTVFAVQSNSGPSKAHTLNFKNNKQFTDYVSYLKSRSSVKTNVKTSSVKKIATLWTCTERSTTGDAGETVSADKARTFVSLSLREVK